MGKDKTPKVDKKVKETLDEPKEVLPIGGASLLNGAHEAFCQEYCITKNATRSYLSNYPESSYKSAMASACDLLRNPSIIDRVAFLNAERIERIKMTANDVLGHLATASRLDPADLYDGKGAMLLVHELPPEVRMCIEGIEYDEVYTGTGDDRKIIGRTAKVKFISKKSALELLARHHKLLTDKVEFPDENGKPQKIGGAFSDTERSARLLFLLEQAEKRAKQ